MPSSPNASPRPPVLSVVTDENSRPLAICAAELRRLSAHRDDAIAIAALAIVDQMAAVPIITAREYESIHLAICASKRAAVGNNVTRTVWAHVYHLSCDAYTALLWAWREQVRGTHATTPVASPPVDELPLAETTRT